jgi:hypothetical protein
MGIVVLGNFIVVDVQQSKSMGDAFLSLGLRLYLGSALVC